MVDVTRGTEMNTKWIEQLGFKSNAPCTWNYCIEDDNIVLVFENGKYFCHCKSNDCVEGKYAYDVLTKFLKNYILGMEMKINMLMDAHESAGNLKSHMTKNKGKLSDEAKQFLLRMKNYYANEIEYMKKKRDSAEMLMFSVTFSSVK